MLLGSSSHRRGRDRLVFHSGNDWQYVPIAYSERLTGKTAPAGRKETHYRHNTPASREPDLC